MVTTFFWQRTVCSRRIYTTDSIFLTPAPCNTDGDATLTESDNAFLVSACYIYSAVTVSCEHSLGVRAAVAFAFLVPHCLSSVSDVHCSCCFQMLLYFLLWSVSCRQPIRELCAKEKKKLHIHAKRNKCLLRVAHKYLLTAESLHFFDGGIEKGGYLHKDAELVVMIFAYLNSQGGMSRQQKHQCLLQYW